LAGRGDRRALTRPSRAGSWALALVAGISVEEPRGGPSADGHLLATCSVIQPLLAVSKAALLCDTALLAVPKAAQAGVPVPRCRAAHTTPHRSSAETSPRMSLFVGEGRDNRRAPPNQRPAAVGVSYR